MAKSDNLRAANRAKNDEFYTAYDDIQRELINYARHFRGKVIYCNCDDHNGIGLGTPKSNFLKYLADNFQAFGIKRVIATHYEAGKHSTMYILDQDNTGDGIICAEDISEIPLTGDGDFRSAECVELLKQADIVITNPPFSLFREYVAQLIEHKKKFLIIGNDNCRTFKEIFPLIKNNKFWCGYNHVKEFTKLDGSTQKFGNVSWYTNLDINKRNEFLDTGKKYYGFENMYPKYCNYNAINVDKTSDIPMDYDGEMGVPITFIDRYCPDQFEIIGHSLELANMNIIKQKQGKVGGGPRFYLETDDGTIKRLYERIVIRKKKEN